MNTTTWRNVRRPRLFTVHRRRSPFSLPVPERLVVALPLFRRERRNEPPPTERSRPCLRGERRLEPRRHKVVRRHRRPYRLLAPPGCSLARVAPRDEVPDVSQRSTERSDAGAARRRSSAKSCGAAGQPARSDRTDVTGFTPVTAPPPSPSFLFGIRLLHARG